MENNFGRIITNGINYWMCISSCPEKLCECGAKVKQNDIYRTVIIGEKGFPVYLQGFKDILHDEIKPMPYEYMPSPYNRLKNDDN